VTVGDGLLTLKMYEDPASTDTVTKWTGGGAQIYTLPQVYGRYLVRMRCDGGAGVSCIALLIGSENWPPEIDFYEDSPTTNTRATTSMTAHYSSANHNPQVRVPASDGYDFTEWHTIGVDWLSSTITYSIDGTVVGSITNPDTSTTDVYSLAQPQNMGVQIQVGDGAFPTSTTPAEVDMQLDWVVIYAPS
jgi:beta-glucanase (GH16 family)